MIPHDPSNTKAEAWSQVARNLKRMHPEFPPASEIARRISESWEKRGCRSDGKACR